MRATRIVMTGGGSGGHITPILAVAHELKQLNSKTELIYIGQTGDSLGDIPAEDENIDRIFTVRAGKFRRYHTEGIKQLFDFRTLFKNLRDILWVIVGLWQSFWLLGRIKPDVIFVKGGFVGVPVGLAAALRRIPYITHDSDALPGLANRIIAPWAKLHAVALPKEVYAYPAQKTVTVGVPISRNFKKLSAAEIQDYRQQLKLNGNGRVLLVTGGGLGAQRLNDAVITCATDILERYPDLQIVHIAGRALETEVRQHYKQGLIQKLQHRVEVKGYINNIYKYSGAADVIVTRAGGTAVAEFAAQAKPIVVVPNPLLAGGHQLKNARVLADRKAVKLVSETHLSEDHHALMPALTELLDNPVRAKELGQKLSKLAQPEAARKLAVLLLDKANNRS
ncbi:MAG TPA: UDP-N-acetylglucosamine--N-acetylmuramyl-(pentapeptide) pyrophosphoryl-undecaprenol N-acetylglucosamine transferase [Patescibacteria group bacterium]|nr:UDP-N-acetylglucosamine--N-acetylmuramyl-(pentapeptide) pyrophosphoryl-undecaprenol N-acetylglucosamine transferase [Patescibacteria group bacterium]